LDIKLPPGQGVVPAGGEEGRGCVGVSAGVVFVGGLPNHYLLTRGQRPPRGPRKRRQRARAGTA